MVESLEVTVTSQVMVTWREVTVISSSDEQMVEAIVSYAKQVLPKNFHLASLSEDS